MMPYTQNNPNALELIGGCCVLGWVMMVWAHYLRIGPIGGGLAIISGITFMHSSKDYRSQKRYPFLFGWNSCVSVNIARYSIIAAISIGPILYYSLGQFLSDAIASETRMGAVLIVSFVIGILISPVMSQAEQ